MLNAFIQLFLFVNLKTKPVPRNRQYNGRFFFTRQRRHPREELCVRSECTSVPVVPRNYLADGPIFINYASLDSH